MSGSSSSPWIVRCSVRLYRWLLCLGSRAYRRQYGDLTLQLFRESCQDAYQQRGVRGVLGLWLPLFGDVVVQMLAEHLSEWQRASQLHLSVETVSSSAAERMPTMKRVTEVYQRFNRSMVIMLSALTRFRRKLTRPLLWKIARELNRPRLKYATNMGFEQHLCHWRFLKSLPQYESGIDTRVVRGGPGAFLRSTSANSEAAATLRQTIKADDYRGKQVRFSGDVKVEHVEQRAGLWIDAIVQSRPLRRGERLQPENVVQGTRGWMNYEETISIPDDADFIRFGIVLHGKGQVWLANPRLEVVEQDGRKTA